MFFGGSIISEEKLRDFYLKKKLNVLFLCDLSTLVF